MSRVGYDAVTVSNMPHDGAIYAGYVDGNWPTFESVRSRFPGKKYVSITVNGHRDALCADVETGDFTPYGGAHWAKDRIARHGIAWLYCNASTWPSVQHEVHQLGIAENVRYWIAHYDGVAVIPPGSIGKQYLGDYHGYDKSIFADHIAGLDPVQLTPTWFVRTLSFPPPPHSAGVTKQVRLAGHLHTMQVGKDVLRVQGKVGATRDGLYGPGTAAKVKEFKAHHGLPNDGIVGERAAIKLGP